MADYDTIVVGSGAGGLTAALSLALAGQKVLVLEQHYLAGGWSHSFQFKGHAFCPGIHYVGELGPGQRLHNVLRELGVAQSLRFHRQPEDGYDHAVSPNRRFSFPVGAANLEAKLVSEFPMAAKGIRRYIAASTRIARQWEQISYFGNGLRDLIKAPFISPAVFRHAFTTAFNFRNRFIKDPALHWILGTQSFDSGLPPKMLSGVLGAIVFDHFVEGGFYPEGGMQRVIEAFVSQLKANNGKLLLKTPVAKILTEKRRMGQHAIGVQLADGQTIRANTVISNADAHTTFQKFIDAETLSFGLRHKLKRTQYSVSNGSMFMVFDAPPRNFGMDGGNIFYSHTGDWDRDFATDTALTKAKDTLFHTAFISSESEKDPSHSSDTYTASLMVPIHHGVFNHVKGGKPRQRSPEYYKLKEVITRQMFKTLDVMVPGYREHLIHYEVGTPLDNAHFVAGHDGCMYGPAKTPTQTGPFAFPIKTEIENLFCCGHSTIAHGLMGVILSGRLAAAKSLGIGLRDLKGADVSR